MKVLVFSDLHCSQVYRPILAKKMIAWIKNVDIVILNGDIWDEYLISFEDFIHSSWSIIFPYLKQKHAQYIFGNHDRPNHKHRDMNLFSDVQVEALDMTIGSNVFHFEHGHRMLPWEQQVQRYCFDQVPGWLSRRMIPIVDVATESRFVHYWIGLTQNNRMKAYWKTIAAGRWLVIGHTHVQSLDHRNLFLNSGLNKYNTFQAVLIESSGAMSLIRE